MEFLFIFSMLMTTKTFGLVRILVLLMKGIHDPKTIHGRSRRSVSAGGDLDHRDGHLLRVQLR